MPTLSSQEIAESIEANFISTFKQCNGISGVVYEEEGSTTQVFSQFDVSWMNGVCKADGNCEDLPAFVAGVLKRHTKPMLWRVGPLTSNQDGLREHLLSIGLTLSTADPGMSLELNKFKKSEPVQDLQIEEVRTAQQIVDWLIPFCDGFVVPPDVGEHFRLILEHFCGRAPSERHFVGYEHGRPACCVTFINGSGVNMIYNVCTVKEFRGKGYARRMVELAVTESLAYRNEPICLYASTMGFPLYKSMGFVEHFTRSDYLYEPK